MKTNTKINRPAIATHEGGRAVHINAEAQLRRSVMASLLWEDTFYENGQDIAKRVQTLVHQVPPHVASSIAIEARSQMYIRHMPLLITRELARHPQRATNPSIVGNTIEAVIQRADELGEFLSLYWKDKRQPLSAQVKKGLAKAFTKFGVYNLAKYNRDAAVKLKDVAFLAHVKPKIDTAGTPQFVERKYKNGTVKRLVRHVDSPLGKLVSGQLEAPDTWEVALSAGKDKKETFLRLLDEKKLGGLAFLRNLRNMKEAGITKSELVQRVANVSFNKVLPFRFIAAAKVVPEWEDLIEPLMLAAMEGMTKLPGKTILLVDVSGSMDSGLSRKSDMNRLDAACGLAILLREVCENVAIVTFSTHVKPVAPRRGFALRDAILTSQPHSSTMLGDAMNVVNANPHDRLIVITDEQSHQQVSAPKAKQAYMLNVAGYQNGVGYGQGWSAHISGFSENCVRFIAELEGLHGADQPAESAE